MAMSKQYQHFCPVARSLEVIGEKWSLLLVRDLLRGPQRFTDLQRYMAGITPKWLTQRLRDLEAAGIVERDSSPGRREVRYHLTPKGRALRPVIEAMVVWGAEYAMRPPRDGEPVFPESVLTAVSTILNHRGTTAKAQLTWRFIFDERTLLLTFDGERWRLRDDSQADADLDVRVGTRAWVEFLAAPADQRKSMWDRIKLEGNAAQVAEFRRVFRGQPGDRTHVDGTRRGVTRHARRRSTPSPDPPDSVASSAKTTPDTGADRTPPRKTAPPHRPAAPRG
jgi:DNA-binding HxlR family transcriptional regulator